MVKRFGHSYITKKGYTNNHYNGYLNKIMSCKNKKK